MATFQVYKITNRMTGMSYIGVTSRPLHVRCGGHRQMAERGLTWPLAVAIRANGWANFEATTLIRCASKDEAYQKEREAIAFFNTLVPNGYNSAPGGPGLSGRTVSAETREKLRRANIGRKPVVLSQDGRARIGTANRGANNSHARSVTYLGLTYDSIKSLCVAVGHSTQWVATRLKSGEVVYATPPKCYMPIGTGKWNLGKKHSEQTKAKLAAIRQNKPNWNVRPIELHGVTYSSVGVAMKELSVTRSLIRSQLKRGLGRYLADTKYPH